METEKIETESPANGAAPPATAKPWTLAGFTSRDAWRASKGQKTAKPKASAEVKAAAAPAKPKKSKKKAKKKAVKKSVKLAPKSKPKKKVKAKKPVKKLKAAAKGKKATKAKKKGPGVKDGSLKPVPVSELSPRMKKVFLAIPKNGIQTLEYIQDKAFGNLPHAKGSSWTRNQLRFLRVHKMVKKLGDGKYKRLV